MVVSERLKSVKSVLVHFNRVKTNQTRQLARYSGDINSFQLKVGSNFYPDQAIAGKSNTRSETSEYQMELFKAMGCYSDSQHVSIINSDNFISRENTVANIGRAVYGIDLDGFSAAGNGSDIESGLNCVLNNPMTITMPCSPPPGGDVVLACSMYVHLLHDSLIKIGGDGRMTKSS